ncbi:O-methyltransferase-like protein [Phanerochaete sordida]|uniref:O-methyltransferase-like protein n=1 Tax=Phanerochaete sordida TaxID=48140 RepID=A0A9P3G308_9APHY|nr:O-methyltransferase-like protein [Phanerochaete sordida]
MSSIEALAKIISAGVQDIEAQCAARGVAYPTPDVVCSSETDTIQNEFSSQATPIIAAAYQLIATLSHPQPYLLGMGLWGYFPTALAYIDATFVPDILREAGPKGLHVNEIAAVTKVHPGRLGRVLRFLATRHVFEEVAPDVFRNTRLSSGMCLGKSVKEIVESPLDRWDKSSGVAAIVSLNGHENMKTAAYMVETLLDPVTGWSEEPTEAAFQRGNQTPLPCYEWLEQPENITSLKKFPNAMRATTHYNSDKAVNEGFEWDKLPAGSLIVDVAGGIGNLTMALAGTHKHLRYVVQDRPAVIKAAQEHWAAKMPGAVEKGFVRLEPHDMFDPQYIRDASVFLLRYTTHNWSDKYATKFLTRMREAAQPTTKLIIIDGISDYLCRDTSSIDDIPGAAKPAAPEPLLPYPDSTIGWGYLMDLNMLAMMNCQERTVGEFVTLLGGAGWKIERICRFEAPLPQQVICVPA